MAVGREADHAVRAERSEPPSAATARVDRAELARHFPRPLHDLPGDAGRRSSRHDRRSYRRHAVDSARVVQLTDTHFSANDGVPAQWPPTLDWLRQDPPDLVVHSGDIVFEDPDDEADRAFARRLLDDVPVRLACIPGNHDVGRYGDEADRARRVRDVPGDLGR